jgi:hypothetical protein
MTTETRSQKELEKYKDSIKVCGTNRGPHHYIPIAWNELKEGKLGNEDASRYEEISKKNVTILLCSNCMKRVTIKEVIENF